MSTAFEPPTSPGVRLSELVRSLWSFLEEAVESPGLISEDFRERALAIRPAVADAAGEVANELESGRHDRALAAVGLAGAQLDLKVFGYGSAVERLRRIWESPGPLNRLPPADWSTVRRRFLSVLGWGNRILSSIIAAMPGLPGAEVLKEAKEAIERALEDAELDGLGP